ADFDSFAPTRLFRLRPLVDVGDNRIGKVQLLPLRDGGVPDMTQSPTKENFRLMVTRFSPLVADWQVAGWAGPVQRVRPCGFARTEAIVVRSGTRRV
ncbi:hypothetical protein, partial [Acidiphilium sp.]|uniref:hypothetical protein n=1 Tax=Acidiphilium sp. TaxID=527 RepID=UPI003D064A2F